MFKRNKLTRADSNAHPIQRLQRRMSQVINGGTSPAVVHQTSARTSRDSRLSCEGRMSRDEDVLAFDFFDCSKAYARRMAGELRAALHASPTSINSAFKSMNASLASAPPAIPIVPIYGRPAGSAFDVYLRQAPEDLRALGIFDSMYEVWPDGRVLQQAAARVAWQKTFEKNKPSSFITEVFPGPAKAPILAISGFRRRLLSRVRPEEGEEESWTVLPATSSRPRASRAGVAPVDDNRVTAFRCENESRGARLRVGAVVTESPGDEEQEAWSLSPEH